MKKILTIIILLNLLFISGCSIKTTIFSLDKTTLSNETKSSTNSSNVILDTTVETFIPIETDASTTTEDSIIDKDEFQELTYYDISNKYGYYWKYLNSIGKQKILVIPVTIKGYEEYTNDIVKSNIETAFFGSKENTSWESVNSYYKTSSYGKLDITGTVLDFTDKAFTYKELSTVKEDIPILEYTYEYLDKLEIESKDYDSDEDGFIDLVCYLFSSPVYDESFDDIPDYFWAYTNAYDDKPNYDKPVVNNYMLASISFMYDNDGLNITPSENFKVDAHTYIHEMGHALGLDDYYNIDYASSISDEFVGDPTGTTTMMDGNISDLDPFSKHALGWIDNVYLGIVEDDSVTYTLNKSESNSETIIIGLNYNGNAFSEYFIMEYYTPTGINEWDALNSINDSDYGINESGIKLYYVDARIGGYKGNNLFELDNSSLIDEYDEILIPLRSNSPTYSQYYMEYELKSDKINEKLISLINASGIDHIKEYNYADEECLFKEGDSYNLKNWATNSGDIYDYTIYFSEQTDDSITVTISKNS